MNWLLPALATALIFTIWVRDLIARGGRRLMSRLLGIDFDTEAETHECDDYEEATLLQRIMMFASGPLAKIAYGMFVLFFAGMTMGEGIEGAMVSSVAMVILFPILYILAFVYLFRLLLHPAAWHWDHLSAAAATVPGKLAPISEMAISTGEALPIMLSAVGTLFVVDGIADLLPCFKYGGKIIDELLMRASPEGKIDRLSKGIISGISSLTLLAMTWILLQLI